MGDESQVDVILPDCAFDNEASLNLMKQNAEQRILAELECSLNAIKKELATILNFLKSSFSEKLNLLQKDGKVNSDNVADAIDLISENFSSLIDQKLLNDVTFGKFFSGVGRCLVLFVQQYHSSRFEISSRPENNVNDGLAEEKSPQILRKGEVKSTEGADDYIEEHKSGTQEYHSKSACAVSSGTESPPQEKNPSEESSEGENRLDDETVESPQKALSRNRDSSSEQDNKSVKSDSNNARFNSTVDSSQELDGAVNFERGKKVELIEGNESPTKEVDPINIDKPQISPVEHVQDSNSPSSQPKMFAKSYSSSGSSLVHLTRSRVFRVTSNPIGVDITSQNDLTQEESANNHDASDHYSDLDLIAGGEKEFYSGGEIKPGSGENQRVASRRTDQELRLISDLKNRITSRISVQINPTIKSPTSKYSPIPTELSLKPQKCPIVDQNDSVIYDNAIKWINYHLRPSNRTVQNLDTDLSDGINLICAVEDCTGKPTKKRLKSPMFPVHKLDNLNTALNVLKSQGLRVDLVSPSDIFNSDKKKISILFKEIMKHYPLPDNADG